MIKKYSNGSSAYWHEDKKTWVNIPRHIKEHAREVAKQFREMDTI